MNIITIVVLVAAVLVIIASYNIYVSIILKKNKVMEAFSGISVQLKKRYDLIPNILTIAEKFMEHEKELMQEVTKLRTQAISLPNDINSLSKKLELDAQIKNKMGQIMVAVENYPQLKSDQTMISAIQTYNEVEEHIAAARRFYNSAVLELNNAVEIFPSSIIAGIIGVKRQEFFNIDESETKPVNAADYLNK